MEQGPPARRQTDPESDQGMSDAVPDSRPQIFLIDGPAPYVHLPDGRNMRRPGAPQVVLFLLVSLALIGVIFEGVLLHHLYSKTQGAVVQNHTGDREDILRLALGGSQVETQRKPSAYLKGPCKIQEGGTILWTNVNSTATFTYLMDYKKGSLMVPSEGYYYFYSKVYLDPSQVCVWVHLSFMRKTESYDVPIELIRSKWFGCHDKVRSGADDTFLGGLFHLMPRDQIYVVLSGQAAKQPLNKHSFVGVFQLY